MRYEFELTLVVRTKPDELIPGDEGFTGMTTQWNCSSIDIVKGGNLTELLGQFLIVLASVHKKIVNDVKKELDIIDDYDIPF